MNPSRPIPRPYWVNAIESAWRKAPIVWLAGVRRAGKTWLSEQFADCTRFNCDLPSVQRLAQDPEALYRSVRTKRVVFDEVHRLDDPSSVLKIGADLRGGPSILATGSSTLAALKVFRDSLAGRKRSLALQPVLLQELDAFGSATIEKRMLHGGLPQRLLASVTDPSFYAEWLDSYFARDIADLFRVERRKEFLVLARTIARQSGGMATVSTLAKEAGVSRPTVMSWLEALRVTQFLHEVPPFHGGSPSELRKQPKLYAFDTGFVCHERGWDSLREEDRGHLWEHLVLEHMLSRSPSRQVFHWRDRDREVDFVIPGARGEVTAIECKWSPDRADPRGLAAFREHYPSGKNYLICPHVPHRHTVSLKGLECEVAEPTALDHLLL